MSEQKIIHDVETDKQVLAVRATDWARTLGCETMVANALEAVGLGIYLPNHRRPFTVPLGDYITRLPENVEISLRTDDVFPSSISYEVAMRLRSYSQEFCGLIYQGTITAEPGKAEVEPVDVDAILTQWGTWNTPYPRAGSEDIAASRRTLVLNVIRWAIDEGFCRTVEDAISSIGLGDYLPPSELDLTVQVEGFGPVATHLNLNRVGEYSQQELTEAVAKSITAILHERGQLEVITAA